MTDVDTAHFENGAPRPLANRGSTPIRPSRSIVVVCGCLTEFRASDPVEDRLYYIDGAGQLCSSCGRRLYPCGT